MYRNTCLYAAWSVGFIFAIGAAFPAAAQTLTVLSGNDYPPFADEALPEGGMATDIVRQAFARMEQPLDIDFRPWERGMVETQAGKYLATFPWSYNTEREKTLIYSEPLYAFNQYFFTRSDAPYNGTSDSDIQGARVCLALSYNTSGLDRLVDEGIVTLVRPQTLSACFRMIESNRADIIRVNDVIGWTTIESLFGKRDGFRMIDTPARSSIQHVLFSRAHPDSERIVPAFNATLAEMKADGTLEAIMIKHLE